MSSLKELMLNPILIWWIRMAELGEDNVCPYVYHRIKYRTRSLPEEHPQIFMICDLKMSFELTGHVFCV